MEAICGGTSPDVGDGWTFLGSAFSLIESRKVLLEFRHEVEEGGLHEEDIYGLLMRMKLYFSSDNSLFANVVLQCDLYETDARKVTSWAEYSRQFTFLQTSCIITKLTAS